MSAEMRPALAPARRTLAALIGLCAIAAIPRLWRLGALGLEVDEGVQGLAVQGWLSHGLPILPSGAMYLRSIPFGAMQALSASIFGVNEFALRLPAALFGIAAVLATFAVAQALFGRRVAWIATAFVALSAWEVELSRYARFYTAFQVCYLLAVLSFLKVLDTGRRRWAVGFAAAALVAMSFHELAIVLVTCFLVPLFDRTSSTRTRIVSLACVVPFASAWLVYRRVFVGWFTALAPPTGLEELDPVVTEENLFASLPGFPPIRFPPHALIDLSSTPERLALLIAAAIALIACIWIVRARRHWTSVLLLLAVVSAVPHQFMFSALSLMAFSLLSASTWKEWRARPMWPVHGSLAAVLVLWTLTLFGQVHGDPKVLALAMFGFPNLLQHFVYWFVLGWPVFLAAVAISGILMARRFRGDAERRKIFLLVAIVAPMTVASLFDAYFESRYVFHLYPLLVILFAWGLVQAWERVSATLVLRSPRLMVAGTALAVCFVASGDVGPRTWGPMFRTYASQRDPMRAIISWRAYSTFHQDQQGPSRFIAERLRPGDKVAAIGLPHQLAVYRFYLGQLDVALSRPQDHGYQRRRGDDIIDWVTGARVVFDPRDLVRTAEATWLIGDRVLLRDELEYFGRDVERDGRALAQDADIEGRDGVTFAKRFF